MSRYHLHIRFSVEQAISHEHEDREAALKQALELACAGATVWVYGHEHSSRPDACLCASCLPWAAVAEYEPGGRRVR